MKIRRKRWLMAKNQWRMAAKRRRWRSWRRRLAAAASAAARKSAASGENKMKIGVAGNHQHQCAWRRRINQLSMALAINKIMAK
jgi:hypothetical protein